MYLVFFFFFFFFFVCLFLLFFFCLFVLHIYVQTDADHLPKWHILWNLARRADGVCEASYGSRWNFTALTLMRRWLRVFGQLAGFHVVWPESSNEEMVFHEIWAILNRSVARQKLWSPDFDILVGSAIWFYFHPKFVRKTGAEHFLRDDMTAE